MSVTSLWDHYLAHGALPNDCPIYDMHGHWGPFTGIHLPASDDETATKYLGRTGVKLFVFCHHQSLFSPDIGNAANIETVRRIPERIRAYCAINPNYPEAVEQDLAAYDDYPDVYVGLKMHPAHHLVPLDDSRYREAFEFANDRKLPVLMHTWGGSKECGYQQVKSVLDRDPGITAILGHSLHGDWEHAIELALGYSNIYLETCAVVDERGILEMLVEGAGSEKVVFGTDFPWFSHYYYIGAVLGADMTDDDRRNIFYRNAERILKDWST